MALAPNSVHSLASQLQRVGEGSSPEVRAHLRSIQTQIEAIANGYLESVLRNAHADATLEIFAPPEFPWIRNATGIDELQAAVQQNFGAVDDQRPEVRDIFAEGDTVILFGRERGVIRDSQTRYDVEFVERFTYREGRLAGVRIVAAHAARP